MSARNNTSNWLPQLIAALGTVSVVYATIRTEVPTIVRQEIGVELVHQSRRIQAHQDSVWSLVRNQMVQRAEVTATSRVDSLARMVGIIAANGQVKRVEQIVAPPDTLLWMKLDSMSKQLRSLRGQIAVMSTRIPPTAAEKKKREAERHNNTWRP